LELQEGTKPLISVLNSYMKEWAAKGTSVPLILSHMNVESSDKLTKHAIHLKTEDAQLLKELGVVLNFRYGC